MQTETYVFQVGSESEIGIPLDETPQTLPGSPSAPDIVTPSCYSAACWTDEWTWVSVPVSEMMLAGGRLTRIDISGSVEEPFYLDDRGRRAVTDTAAGRQRAVNASGRRFAGSGGDRTDRPAGHLVPSVPLLERALRIY